MALPRSKSPEKENEVNFERAAYLGLTFPSDSVRLVRSASNRSAHLPMSCEVCRKMITDYPFVAKHHPGYRKYHIECALRIGLVSLTPAKT